ncbi:MAG: hypothetical protein ACR2O6_02155 [Ilumatobacteraceae bacterium]
MATTIQKPTVREAPERLPDLPEHVDELPAGVAVPDDLSGLELAEPGGSTRGGRSVRWLPWVAVITLLVAGVGALLTVLRDNTLEQPTTDYTKAQVMIEQSIDEALRRQEMLATDYTTSYDMVQQSIDEALAERHVELTTDYTRSQAMVQRSIDEALVERHVELTTDYTRAQVMIEASIDEALAELAS